MVVTQMRKTKWYTRPHYYQISFGLGMETGVANRGTIIPHLMHDEGLGTPSAYEAHPENAAFVVAGEPNCFPESTVNAVSITIQLSLTKAFFETDKLHVMRIGFMPIMTSFEDHDVTDELTGESIKSILEMDDEDTDNQSYPLWSGVDMPAGASTANTLPTNVPGLTTDQVIEGVSFVPNTYYSALQYFTIAGKLKSVQRGLKWITLTKAHPTKLIKIHITSKNKRMVKKSFLGTLIWCPQSGNQDQLTAVGDTTNITHCYVSAQTRFNEWNQEFNFKKV